MNNIFITWYTKLPKVLLFLLCFTFVCYQGWKCTVKYLDGNVATRISHQPLRNFPLPSIGLCQYYDDFKYDSDVFEKYGLEYINYTQYGIWTSSKLNENGSPFEPMEIYKEATSSYVNSMLPPETEIWIKMSPNGIYDETLTNATVVDTRKGKCVVYDLPEQTLNGGILLQNPHGVDMFIFMKNQFRHIELGSMFFVRSEIFKIL